MQQQDIVAAMGKKSYSSPQSAFNASHMAHAVPQKPARREKKTKPTRKT